MRPDTRAARRGSRLFVALLASMFLALLGTAGYTYVAYRSAAAELVIERDRQVTYLSASRLQAELSKFNQILTSVARTEGVQRADQASRSVALEQAGFRLADFDGGVVLLDHFGEVVAAQPAQPELLGQDWSNRDLFRQVLTTHSVEYSNALPSGITGGRVIAIGVPVLGEGGQFAGALVGMFRLGEPTVSSFYASIVRLRLGQSGNVYVVDGTGLILYDTSSTLAGRSFAVEVMPALTFEGQAGSVRRKDVQGRDVLVSYAQIPGTPWTLVSEEDWRTLTASTRPYANLLLAALGIGMVIPAVVVGVLVRQRNLDRQEQEQEQHDRQIARQMHHRLSSRELPLFPGWEILIHRPAGPRAEHLIDDHLVLGDGRLMLSLLRVTDEGLGGAVSMISGRAALRGAAQCGLEPAEALRRANHLLCLDNPADRPVHGLFGVLDPQRGEFTFAHAGIAAPLQHPAQEEALLLTAPGNLGVQLDQDPTCGRLTVPPGGSLILTAGLIEPRGATGESFGVEKVRACLSQDGAEPRESLQAILFAAQQSGLAADDEVLIVWLKRESGSPAGEGGPDR